MIAAHPFSASRPGSRVSSRACAHGCFCAMPAHSLLNPRDNSKRTDVRSDWEFPGWGRSTHLSHSVDTEAEKEPDDGAALGFLGVHLAASLSAFQADAISALQTNGPRPPSLATMSRRPFSTSPVSASWMPVSRAVASLSHSYTLCLQARLLHS